MELTKNILIDLWRKRETIFNNPDNRTICKRFEFIKQTFNTITNHAIKYSNVDVYIDDDKILIKDKQDVTHSPSLDYFGCSVDGVTAPKAYAGIENMEKRFDQKYKSLIMNIGRMLGGFDEKGNMCDEFRIISNVVKSCNDNGSLTSGGIMRHPSSNFADNNYFFNVIDTVNTIRTSKFDLDSSRLVLRYPEIVGAESAKDQRDILKFRFPYKFFFMWANREKMIHPVSLLAYKNLVKQKDADLQCNWDYNLDASFDKFSNDDKEGWKIYSQRIFDLFPKEEREQSDFVEELSKLLSIVLCTDRGIRDPLELLNTGNKALILWGPPGTGKTYSAELLVQSKLGIKKEEMNNYSFEKGDKDDKGQWAIVQFHPSYSYEDFIGGISPKLEGTTLTYYLKEGIFKRFCEEASKHSKEGLPYVFVIDEINRADLSSVFGELMYTLEYRDREISLPNFDNSFSIPNNVYLIGTMNSLDKSLTTFDLALRRRFAFFKVKPDLKALEVILTEKNISEDNLQDFIMRCERLNHDITDPQKQFRLGEDYQIGHAYFAKIKDFLEFSTDSQLETKIGIINSVGLKKLWMYHIQPLLEEFLGSRIDDADIQDLLKKEEMQFTQ